MTSNKIAKPVMNVSVPFAMYFLILELKKLT
jgi:hypothetical protein